MEIGQNCCDLTNNGGYWSHQHRRVLISPTRSQYLEGFSTSTGADGFEQQPECIGGAVPTRRHMDHSSLQLIRDVGTKLSKHSRPTKDYIIKSLRVMFLHWTFFLYSASKRLFSESCRTELVAGFISLLIASWCTISFFLFSRRLKCFSRVLLKVLGKIVSVCILFKNCLQFEMWWCDDSILREFIFSLLLLIGLGPSDTPWDEALKLSITANSIQPLNNLLVKIPSLVLFAPVYELSCPVVHLLQFMLVHKWGFSFLDHCFMYLLDLRSFYCSKL